MGATKRASDTALDMEEKQLNELLEKWGLLEPKKVYLFPDRCVLVGWQNPGDGVSFLHEITRAKKALIQVAVQEAIEDRCWHYEQRWLGTTKIGYVYPPGIPRLIRHESDCHAESLLAAYIEALELTKET